MRMPSRHRASGIPTAQPTIRPVLLCFGGGSVNEPGGGMSAVLVELAVPGALPVELDVAEVEKPVDAPLGAVEGEGDEEPFAADVEDEDEGGVGEALPPPLPLPEALPVIDARFGAVDPMLPPAVP